MYDKIHYKLKKKKKKEKKILYIENSEDTTRKLLELIN